MRSRILLLALCALVPVTLLCAGCRSGGRSSGGSAQAATAAENARISFRSYNFSKDTAGTFVVVAQVRVRAASGTGTRDYYVKAGDAIGRLESDGDFRTGLTVDKIDKGQRPIRTRVGGKDVTVVMESYYLLARGLGGRKVFWLVPGRTSRPAPTKQ